MNQRTLKSTKADKIRFILNNFPEVIDIKNIRTQVLKVTNIKRAMYRAGLYANTYDSASASTDASIIKMIEALQDQHLAAKKYIDQKTDPCKGS